MKLPMSAIICAALCSFTVSPTTACTEKEPVVDVRGPTVVGFFKPVTQEELEQAPDINEALADFQLYASRIREPLRKQGIEFDELYAHSFRLRVRNRLISFRPVKVDVGYYFITPGKSPRIEYGVMTDADLLQAAKEYFGIAARQIR
jgi:hypothetical protein